MGLDEKGLTTPPKPISLRRLIWNFFSSTFLLVISITNLYLLWTNDTREGLCAEGTPFVACLCQQGWLQDSWCPETSQAPPSETFSGLQQAGTDLVQWDEYSLIIRGKRVFIQSGEFHTWRLPVADLWPDIVQKFKAAGLNTMSIYVHWGLVNPTPGKTYWDGFLALQPLFDACKRAGIWVIVRPGPYINAGGIPGWVTVIDGHLRTNDTAYHDAWQQYIREVSEITARYQISEGGPVIAVQVDNEYVTDAHRAFPPGKDGYMQELIDAFRKWGIVVPITFNDASQGDNFAHGVGAADIYGLDSYPQSFDCSRPKHWNPVVENFHSYHERVNPKQPLFIPEFQSGAFDPWGPNAPGYGKCAELLNPQFQSVFFLNNWAANVKMINLYMMYGGTSHGYLAFPGVYTSYDYAAPIAEDRSLTDRYAELKRQSFFLRSTPDFYKTDVVANSSTTTYSSSPSVFVTELRNPDTKAGFYIVRNEDSTSAEPLSFKLDVATSLGDLTIPRLTSGVGLEGRESRAIVTDYRIGGVHVFYSTASVLFAGKVGAVDFLYLYGNKNETLEASFNFSTKDVKIANVAFPIIIEPTRHAKGASTVLWTPESDSVTVLQVPGAVIALSNKDVAGEFWAPILDDANADVYDTGAKKSVVVFGPYLVRSASLSEEGDLKLSGDIDRPSTVIVFTGTDLASVEWNGGRVDCLGDDVMSSMIATTCAFRLDFEAPSIKISDFGAWKYKDTLPEIRKDYDDEDWIVANRTGTTNPWKPHVGKYTLYACDYGFCNGATLWRAHFDDKDASASAVKLEVAGGEAFASSVWLNDVFLGSSYGNSSNNLNIIEATNSTYKFPKDAIKKGKNVITVVQDNMGMDEAQNDNPDTSKHPRGILGYELVGSDVPLRWRVQGQQGGFSQIPDPTRGITNENGFHGIRHGWHVPDFDASAWEERSPITGGLDSAGIGFFRTTVTLDVPVGYDVLLSFNFKDEEKPYRVEMWVNGWQMGRRVANLGPQVRFPVQEGILNYQGTNTVALALWAMESSGAKIGSFELKVDKVLKGGVGRIRSDNPSQRLVSSVVAGGAGSGEGWM